MIGPYVHQLYFWTIYRSGLKFGRAKLQGKRKHLATVRSPEWNGPQTKSFNMLGGGKFNNFDHKTV